MIEQHNNQLVVTLPTSEAAAAFSQFLATLFQPHEPSGDAGNSEPLSAPYQPVGENTAPAPPSPPPFRSRHTILTPERQDQIAQQRASGQSANQRLLRAQTTLRDGVLPFSRPGSPPPPTNQPSPRQRAAAEGGFADGSGEEPELERKLGRALPGKGSHLRPVQPAVPQPSPAR